MTKIGLRPWVYKPEPGRVIPASSIDKEVGHSIWKMNYFEVERQAQSRIKVRLSLWNMEILDSF